MAIIEINKTVEIEALNIDVCFFYSADLIKD